METTYEAEGKGVVVSEHALLRGGDILQAMNEIYAPERLARLRYIVWDFTGLTDVDISMTELNRIAMHGLAAAREDPRMIVAIVTSHPRVVTVTRILDTYRHVWDAGLRAKKFSSLADARAWIASLTATVGKG